MKKVLLPVLLLLSSSAFSGEFSKIDVTVREALESHFYNYSINIFEDISDLEIIEKKEGCFLVLKANIKIENDIVQKQLCLNKKGYDYSAEVI